MTIIKQNTQQNTPNKLQDMDFDDRLEWAKLHRSKLLGSKKADKKIQEFKQAHGMLDAETMPQARGGGGGEAASAASAQGQGASDAGSNASHAQREETRRRSKGSTSKEENGRI